jgi:hypothetical protein
VPCDPKEYSDRRICSDEIQGPYSVREKSNDGRYAVAKGHNLMVLNVAEGFNRWRDSTIDDKG